MLHVAIGDYFVKKIAEERPEAEKQALMAQAGTEMAPLQTASRPQQRRGGPGVLEEVIDFLKEEMDAAESVLVGPLSDGDEKPGEAGY